ncbi:hypothetical protein OHA98_03185 [Streptomyces sp. NBC_00654]|uniref:hypothetical protein n=1 Tax=Streptomyces sp. NBC_00654 TaxID=2975799 RepID=UPI002256C54C|nr:hypothetical protein [Streptomyces sp. NBC_00654]MCX4963836.1 hypothetical protein [Streptomyces sp. NBC_00654]
MRENRTFFAAVIGAACLNVLLFAGTANAGTDDDLPWTKAAPTAGATLTATNGTDDDLPWTGPGPSPSPSSLTVTAAVTPDAASGDTEPGTGTDTDEPDPDLPWTR